MLSSQIEISLGQFSDRGRKPANQDFHGAVVPGPRLRTTKGVALAIADGISTSTFGRTAAETAVKCFLSDYFCTSEAWNVKTSARKVISAANSWLHAATRHGGMIDDRDRGYVCTFSAVVFKSHTAHVFHIGDGAVMRISGSAVEPLTVPHRVSVGGGRSYLGRALGVNPEIEIDYCQVPVSVGDVFVLATDGICDYAAADSLFRSLARSIDLESAAKSIARMAYEGGVEDNLTIQIARIDALPPPDAEESLAADTLPLARSLPEPGDAIDQWRIEQRLHASDRSHVYSAVHAESGTRAALKFPSTSVKDDPAFLRRFLMEEWVARRVDNPHLLRAAEADGRRSIFYTAMELLDARSLGAWMRSNPEPGTDVVIAIVAQIAQGLQAMHRRQMLHQDLRPENILIDAGGHVTVIDFGSAWIAGVDEIAGMAQDRLPGTQQYMAPEYLLGDPIDASADVYSLGVIAYQMFSGRLPYGTAMARTTDRRAQRRIRYLSLPDLGIDVPVHVDAALRRAVHPDPAKRYGEVSEFAADLARPDHGLPGMPRTALLERDPVLFWKSLAILLFVVALGLVWWIVARPT